MIKINKKHLIIAAVSALTALFSIQSHANVYSYPEVFIKNAGKLTSNTLKLSDGSTVYDLSAPLGGVGFSTSATYTIVFTKKTFPTESAVEKEYIKFNIDAVISGSNGCSGSGNCYKLKYIVNRVFDSAKGHSRKDSKATVTNTVTGSCNFLFNPGPTYVIIPVVLKLGSNAESIESVACGSYSYR